jgi:hypothetical protein
VTPFLEHSNITVRESAAALVETLKQLDTASHTGSQVFESTGEKPSSRTTPKSVQPEHTASPKISPSKIPKKLESKPLSSPKLRKESEKKPKERQVSVESVDEYFSTFKIHLIVGHVYFADLQIKRLHKGLLMNTIGQIVQC